MILTRIENREKYKKKRKSRKDDGVCGKNKESTRGSRSGVEESIGGYEKASRLGQERDSELEEGR